MSALLTHAAAGLLYGLFAWALAHKDGLLTQWWHPVALFAALGFASLLPDLDLWIGTHRQTLHNVWFLLVIPASAVTLIHLHPRVPGSWFQPALHLVPGAIASELWYDLFAPSLSGYTEIFWPLSSVGYEHPGQEILYVGGKPIFDAGTLLLLLLIFYLVLGLLHSAVMARVMAIQDHRAIDGVGRVATNLARRLPDGFAQRLGAAASRLGDRQNWRHALCDKNLALVAASLVHVALAMVPIVYVLGTGQLVRISI